MRMEIGNYKPIHGTDGRWTTFKSKIKHAFKVFWFWFKMAIAGATLVVGTYAYTVFGGGNVVYAQNMSFPAQKQEAPILQRIADCESGNGTPGSGTQFKHGKVVTHTNANGTVDLGKWQLNLSAEHLTEMAKLGFDPLTEAGNYGYARFIYEHRGTSDWMSSAHCWMI